LMHACRFYLRPAMPKERLSMRKIREILRLSAAGLSARQIAGSVGVARSTVADCLLRAGQADLGWPLPAALDDVELERRLYPPAPVRDDAVPVPDWPRLHAELQRKGVTLLLLWQEYKATVPAGGTANSKPPGGHGGSASGTG